MSLVGKNFMSKEDLIYFNKTVNDRIRGRLKYKGDYAIHEGQTNWDSAAPSEPGHLWQLIDIYDEKVEIDGVTYKAGEWVMVMNKTIKNEDGTIVDEDGNPTHVDVIKLISNGIADGEENGNGLAFVNGEWELQKDYGYHIPGATEGEWDVSINPSGTAVLNSLTGFIEGENYIVTIGDESHTLMATSKNELLFPDTSIWDSIRNDHGHFLLIASDFGEVVGHDYHVRIEGEQYGEYHTFDPRYIDPISLVEKDSISIYDTKENTLYKTVENVYELFGRLKLTSQEENRYELNNDGVIFKDGELFMTWEEVAKKWEDSYVNSMFEFTDSGNYWIYRYNGTLYISYSPVEPNLPPKTTIWTVDNNLIHIIYCNMKAQPDSNFPPTGQNDGDIIMYIDGEWKVMPNYGYKKLTNILPNTDITFEDYGGFASISMPATQPLVVGNQYQVVINNVPLEGKAVLEDDYPTINFDTSAAPYTKLYYKPATASYYLDGDSSLIDSKKLVSINVIDYATIDKHYLPDTLPEGANDGDALVYVNGEWKLMPNYGYKILGSNIFMNDALLFDGSASYASATISAENPLVPDQVYTLVFDGVEYEGQAILSAPNKVVFYPIAAPIQEITYNAAINECSILANSSLVGTVHSIKVFKSDEYITFDPKYLPDVVNAIIDVDNIESISQIDINRKALYRVIKDVYDITSPNHGRYELGTAKIAEGYSTNENGIVKEDHVEITWEEALAAWDTTYLSWFDQKEDGSIWRYDFDGVQYLEKRDSEPNHPLKATLHMYAESLEGEKWYTIYDSLAKTGEQGASSYLALTYKPQINGVELVNNKTSTELGIIVNLTQAEYDALVADDMVNPETAYFITDGEKTVTTTNYEELSNKPSIAGLILREGMELNDFNLMTKTEIESKLSSIMAFKGTVDTFSDLPAASLNEQGDVWYVRNDEGDKLRGNYAWTGADWTDVGGSVDMSPYQKKEAEIPLLTTNQTIEGSINELYSNKLAKEPGNLDTTATSVVGAINEIKTATDELKENIENCVINKGVLSQTTAQNLFDAAFAVGKTQVYNRVSFSQGNNPPGVGAGTTGLCIVSVNNNSEVLTSRWGSILWQSQGDGEIYICYMDKGVVSSWRKLNSKPLYSYSMDFRVDANKKFGITTPYYSSTTNNSSVDVWRYYQNIANPANNDHFQTLITNPLTLSWNGLPSGAIVLAGAVRIGGSGDNATITLKIRYFLNGNVSDYTYDLGTIANPKALVYKPTMIQII